MSNAGFIPNLGDVIRGHRRNSGLMQKDLAAAIGVSATTINKIERGLIAPRMSTLQKIASVLGFNYKSVLTGPDLSTEAQSEFLSINEQLNSFGSQMSSINEKLSLITEEFSKFSDLLAALKIDTKSSGDMGLNRDVIEIMELLNTFSETQGYDKKIVIKGLKEALLTNPIGVSVILRLPPTAVHTKSSGSYPKK